jgi:pimeloyl-ACP methyl ester carboxylesterase
MTRTKSPGIAATTSWPHLMVWVMVSVVCLTTLSACDMKLPWDKAKEPAAATEEPAVGEEEGSVEGEGEGETPPPKPIPKPPTYQTLSDFPTQSISLTAADGFALKGQLYDAWQVAHPPAPPPDPNAEASEEEAPVPSAEGDRSGEGDGEEATAPATKPPKPTDRYPLIILVHGLGGEGRNWREWIPGLVRQGYAVLAVDVRGHGQSTHIMATGFRPWRLLDAMQWQAATKDMDQWMRYASGSLQTDQPQVASGPFTLIGVGLGANLALVGAGNNPQWATQVVALAPGLDYKGIAPAVPMLQFEKPIFFAASQSDTYALSSAEKLYKIAQGPKQLRLFKDIGTGLDMTRNYPPLKAEILAWVAKHQPPHPTPKGMFKP